ncbi:Inactivated superfamily I helicase [Rhodocyclus tenuis]|uniref:PD-(D/E)XK nuclease family protein n=1 Tax=Rhodocyclus gracilis TaxID=2929842 RepID=UPI001298ABC4|nr:PD-(D/E)XK nuclease family protein [Rhodocyclus gracilis]MRD72481.1 Inactivated superfamily I helicase [Rhodocyclus gracilis]
MTGPVSSAADSANAGALPAVATNTEKLATFAAAVATRALPPGDGFFDAVAQAMLARIAAVRDDCGGSDDDFSAWLVLAPSLPIASELRQSFVRLAGRPVLLPHFDVLRRWAEAEPVADLPAAMTDSERLALLYDALRQRNWFDEGARWTIAGELAELFDELTAAAVALPDDDAALAEQLARAYDTRLSAPLAFEARLVVELWRALSAIGRPDGAALQQLRLARLAATAARPMLVVLDAAPDEALSVAEREFLVRWAARQTVAVFYPQPRCHAATPVQAALDAAWPEVLAAHEATPPLIERARSLAATHPLSPLAERLALVSASGREAEAEAAVAQVFAWLGEGRRRIALISQDRLTARRVRALLERDEVLVADETGWKLSTSRAAACVDALLKTVAGGAYHRDLLDLVKSPYVVGGMASSPEMAASDARETAIFVLEAAVRAASAVRGLPRMRHALRQFAASSARMEQAGAATHAGPAAQAGAASLLDRVDAALTLLADRPAPLARWIERLEKALDALGARAALRSDAAGAAVLDLLALRHAELIEHRATFSFASWREWLSREFESGSFRDASVASPVVLTPLNAVALRHFDAALLLGGDARQLAPAAGGAFFNQSVRRELGLRTHDDARREMRRDLELLLVSVPRVVVVWQSEIDGEANLPAPEIDVLSALHQLAWADDLRRAPLARAVRSLSGDDVPSGKFSPPVAHRAAPSALAAAIPGRITVSGYATLLACPYRFFARSVLGLGAVDEVAETVDKSDYGALVHRVLERFHAQHASLESLSPEAAREALRRDTEQVFAPAIEENALALGWRLRWEKRLDAYLAWQGQREAEGWRWQQAETSVKRVFTLADGTSLEVAGRIDRVDRLVEGAADSDVGSGTQGSTRNEAGVSLLDYKTRTAKAIRDGLADDVQLPAYALLWAGREPSRRDDGAAELPGGDAHVLEAAYIALDDETVGAVAAVERDAEALADLARAHAQRLVHAFSALRAGAPLPAHGADSACRWCEMAGLCRREHV